MDSDHTVFETACDSPQIAVGFDGHLSSSPVKSPNLDLISGVVCREGLPRDASTRSCRGNKDNAASVLRVCLSAAAIHLEKSG